MQRFSLKRSVTTACYPVVAAVLIVQFCLVPASAEHKGKPHGMPGDDDSGGNVFFDVEFLVDGMTQWEDLDSSRPVSRVGRLHSKFGSNFVVNASSPECATRARTNVNFISSLPNVDACFPLNVGFDRVYGGALVISDTSRDLLDTDARDVALSIPDALTTDGKSTSYRIYYTVVGSSHDISSGVDPALRSLNIGQTLILYVDGWILDPQNGKRTNCSGSGALIASLKFTRNDTPCN